jgi:hypothetical protein
MNEPDGLREVRSLLPVDATGVESHIMGSIVFSAVLVAVALTACAESAWSPRTPAPVPSGATPITLVAAPPAEPLPAGVEWACPSALLGDVRVLRDGDEIVFERAFGGMVDLVWPRGFSGWVRDGKAEIVAPDGSIVAREGDIISERLTGTEAGICAVDDVLFPPAS